PTFMHVLTLVAGALLATGRRTVTAALRAAGLGEERHFTTYHRVLNRAAWSPLALSRILLGLLVCTFRSPAAPLVVALWGTEERPQRALPRCGALDVGPPRDDRGHPLALPHGARAQSLERSGMGAALPRHPDALARVEPDARQAPSHDS